MPRIFLTHIPEMLENYYGDRAVSALRELGEVRFNPGTDVLDAGTMADAARGCDIIVSDRQTAGPAEFFAWAPDVVAFLRCAIDIRNIDVAAASAAGVLVTQATAGFLASVSEVAIGFMVDLGRVGEVANVDAKIVEQLISSGFIPVIAPIAVDRDGHSLNVNADTAAGAIAGTMNAAKLMLMTDVEGVKTGSGERLSSLDAHEAERLIEHAGELLDSGLPVVIAGDFNIVPEPRDIYVTTSYRDNALVQPGPREQFRRLQEQGWTDALRKLHPDETIYTFWDYMRNRWERDAGLRLDHFLISKKLVKKLKGGGVDKHVRGREGASDHAPVWIELDV